MPIGGTAGQVLTKTSDGYEWQDAQAGLPEDGTTGQILMKTESGAEWSDAPSGLPDGGSNGQVLTHTSTGAAWRNPTGITQSEADGRYLQTTTAENTYLKLSGGTLTGSLTLSGNPSSNLQAATKQYVDSQVGGIDPGLTMYKGTSQPSASSYNFYFNTNTKVLYVSNGSSWQGVVSVWG